MKLSLLFWLVNNWKLFIFFFWAIIIANLIFLLTYYYNFKKKQIVLRRKIWQYNENKKKFEKQWDEKEKLFQSLFENNLQKEKKIQEDKKKVENKEEEFNKKIEIISQINKEEAREILFLSLKKEIELDLEKYAFNRIENKKKTIEEEIEKLIFLALEKYDPKVTFTKMTKFLQVEDKEIISKIIGKDGRNIIFFRKITGTDVIIDEKKKSVGISCFNSFRREIASKTMQILIERKRISPLYIEQIFQKVSKEIAAYVNQVGNKVVNELQINNIHQGLINYIGQLEFRNSYRQNVLEHCLEVAELAGIMAAELGMNIVLARRAGLLHDIGKSLSESNSHVTNGIILAKRYNEPPEIINAISSHHRNIEPDNIYSLLVIAADSLSAGRPGARNKQTESFIIRMKNIEKLGKKIRGIKKIYALQAGREILVLVDAEKLNDYQAFKLSEKIKEKIQTEIIIPGDVVVSVIREKVFIQKIIGDDSE